MTMAPTFAILPGTANFRFGSEADINPNTRLRPLLGVKQTLDVCFLKPNVLTPPNVRFRG